MAFRGCCGVKSLVKTWIPPALTCAHAEAGCLGLNPRLASMELLPAMSPGWPEAVVEELTSLKTATSTLKSLQAIDGPCRSAGIG